MTGHLLVGNWKLDNGKWKPVKKGPLDEKINLFIHVLFFLDDRQMIALSDLRKFAKIELWKTEDLLRSKEFKDLGPEPLEKGFTFKKFKECLKIPSSSPDPLGHYGAGKKGKIKQVLMDPNVIAGIGNIYSNEALWWAKINPQKGALKLTEKELKSLYRSIKKVLVAGIKLGGESFSDYRNVEGRKGNFDDERKVYQREGQKCFRCKTPIQRLKFGGRSAFFCPHCQNPY